MEPILIGSLFSGYGGLTQGVARALGGNTRTMFVSDIEPGPCALLAHHESQAPNIGDITQVDPDGLPDVDVVEGGSPCFPTGTPVLTGDGFKPIEQVQVGDLVLTHLGRWEPVLKTGSRIADTIILKGEGAPPIECTPNHPFYSAKTRRRAVDSGEWVEAIAMRGRKWLVMEDVPHWEPVLDILPGRSNVRVHNLEVAEDNSYTACGIAVHNCQSMSLAGLRAGMREGTRSGLWSYQRDLIAVKRPALAIWENVAGSLTARASSRMDVERADQRAKILEQAGLCACDQPMFEAMPGFEPPTDEATRVDDKYLEWAAKQDIDASGLTCDRCGLRVYEDTPTGLKSGGARLDGLLAQPTIRALGRVLGDLANLGYDAVWRIVEASQVGAPHHRQRVFVTAWPRDPKTVGRESDDPTLNGLAALPPICPKSPPWAVWDENLDVWTLPDPDLFGEPSVFMDGWPKQGVMADGKAHGIPSALEAL